ncbi:hypothetical protein K9O30_06725 [Clostridium bowmanii]|uniref:hypothetical protein n=1 Tax=Clostridium bowmanii TaxID=132925 RepID=UPI001C0D7759|nr:hypothetical protein [Clostridium bowmanii]MBU3191317.1 hypothetical protein [Clostridium bowmanii]MCA1073433.1 hypothetical protein [Clostridium bowmanii]
MILEDELDNEFSTINNINEEVTYIHNYITSKGLRSAITLLNLATQILKMRVARPTNLCLMQSIR